MGWLDFFKGKKKEGVVKKAVEFKEDKHVEAKESVQSSQQLRLCGVELERMPANADELNSMMARAAIAIIPHLPTEQDVYWFVIEQYDRIISCGETVASITATYPFHPCEIEYLNRKSEDSYVGHKNPGIVYVLNAVLPDLVRHYGMVPAQTMLAFIFGTYLHGNTQLIQALRLKYAVHYHNNCMSAGNLHAADQWGEVITALDK
ncbi:hypothetical protein PPUJ20028_42020 [Pseudomonas putida]|uniref:Uncharacterized protein n=1 Tax=Pseudomonas putida TaxID=303 RepID=A0AA37RIC9_PSEPU|nr:hypothetical protein [Pseudomonas putida]GLO15617.1 hypothetical protein PPUJ20028_42020 [Pseudomonas putida]GLO37149.1 hypothetical protein PPUN14671_39850 [Pseudomonas putida]HDS0965520.1 hypothetical protein [Pseudomonas putida]HDS0993442.1 hypothetical protein [Pseudomonas putida]